MEDNKQINPQDNLEVLTKKLDGADGASYWRSFEEMCGNPEFLAKVKHEFPQEPSWWDRSTTRRSFLQLMGGMIAMTGLAGCTRQPDEKIVPYVKAPEDIIPGKPLFFATAILHAGFARGVLVESHMGRPTKIEGNPEHPDSLGASDAVTQASILSLYDPDRSKTVYKGGVEASWTAFSEAWNQRLAYQKKNQGKSLRIVTGTVISPTLASQIQQLLTELPNAKWVQYDISNRDHWVVSNQNLFGKDYQIRYNIEKSDIILSIDSDFIQTGPGSVRYAKEFADRRRARKGKVVSGLMNRLYSVESMPTVTGLAADHRLALKSSEIELFLNDLAHELGMQIKSTGLKRTDEEALWLHALAKDLKDHQGKSLIVIGNNQSSKSISLVQMMNQALGNVGKTLEYTQTVEAVSSNQTANLKNLSADLLAGSVDDLIVMDSNIVYTAPSDLQMKQAIEKAKHKFHFGVYHDETSVICNWHIPASHSLETWSDARAYDGTVTIIQPLIHPLYQTKSAHEFIAGLLGKWTANGYDVVKAYWKKTSVLSDFTASWGKALHDGIIQGTRFEATLPEFKADVTIPEIRQIPPSSYEINTVTDPVITDEATANNGWLQELPKPITRITWGNAVFMSPQTAKQLEIKNDALVEVQVNGRKLQGPAWIVPGHAAKSFTVYLGFGRSHTGKVSSSVGFNANVLRVAAAPYTQTDVTIQKIGGTHRIACVQDHHSMEGRNLVREATVDAFKKDPEFAQHMSHEPAANNTLYNPSEHLKGENQWGMTIDLNTCIGCNACTIACQSENNIPIVGYDQVLNGREMHWIRVDRYFEGDMENPKAVHQPVPCMHCENAPCEPVCPVGATTHSDTGLNDMVYNRCVGTRYCSNNCTYKVRRFNFYQYSDLKTPVKKLGVNPDVTVRTRGVMEKCTYCVQRINAAHIESRKDGRKIKDGEIVTACQQTCPTQAIQFGDIKDETSRVAIEKADGLNYGLLTELGTRPRTSYLAKLRNPNPALEKHVAVSAHSAGGHH